jgi:hypothetical protein
MDSAGAHQTRNWFSGLLGALGLLWAQPATAEIDLSRASIDRLPTASPS